MDACVAATLSDYVAAEYRDRPNDRSSGAAPDEPVCYRTVDGVSAVCSDLAADDDKLWHYCSISPASILLGSLDSSAEGTVANGKTTCAALSTRSTGMSTKKILSKT